MHEHIPTSALVATPYIQNGFAVLLHAGGRDNRTNRRPVRPTSCPSVRPRAGDTPSETPVCRGGPEPHAGLGYMHQQRRQPPSSTASADSVATSNNGSYESLIVSRRGCGSGARVHWTTVRTSRLARRSPHIKLYQTADVIYTARCLVDKFLHSSLVTSVAK